MFLLVRPLWLHAQLEIVPDTTPQTVFAGTARTIRVLLHNPTDHSVTSSIRTRLFQASSSTAMPLEEAKPWMQIQVRPGQTVIESASLNFPVAKAASLMLVRWLDDHGGALGATKVVVYPADLLKDLMPLTGEKPLGVLDPADKLKPLFRASGIELEDLEKSGWEDVHAKLAIIGPFASEAQMPAGLGARVKSLSKTGVAVVWLKPAATSARRGVDLPVVLLHEGAGVVVVWETKTFSNLAEAPAVQLNLIHLATMALNPELLFHLDAQDISEKSP